MTQLELQAITKRYRQGGDEEIVAVEDLDLTLEEGEFLVLVGPSGCGKSTTLRMIAGLESTTEGEIRIDNEVVNGSTPEERNIAMVFQNYALYPHMTARQNIGFGLKMTTDLSKAEINERAEEAARLLDIENLLDDKPKELSGGQQQRVALGRAIVREPTVFLMDEPLSNLDAKLRTQMRTEIQELQQNLDTTTVYVTHDQTEAMTMGDRIAVLDGGRLQQVGTPIECYHEPTNLFVAGFIGEPSMNFFETEQRESTLMGTGFEYETTNEQQARLPQTNKMTLGIRPEDIRLVGADDTNRTAVASVRVVEPMGDQHVLHLDLESQDVTVTIPESVRVQSGTEVGLLFPPERVHLFDPSTGEALVNRADTQSDQPHSFESGVARQ